MRGDGGEERERERQRETEKGERDRQTNKQTDGQSVQASCVLVQTNKQTKRPAPILLPF